MRQEEDRDNVVEDGGLRQEEERDGVVNTNTWLGCHAKGAHLRVNQITIIKG